MENIEWKVPEVAVDILTEELFDEKNISVSVLRLDIVDPLISGNKIFKLKYYLLEAISNQATIITFGGAYSNHLYATAAACKKFNIHCIGIVRGERSINLSHTLLFCESQGMQLKFISRSQYEKKEEHDFLNELLTEFGSHILIPEGGSGSKGVTGAEEIASCFDNDQYSHICCAVGTGTTLSGLINRCNANTKLLGFNMVNKQYDLDSRIDSLHSIERSKNYNLINEYHFGGYARRSQVLLSFMNNFYQKQRIPTDFVYTGKMLYGIYELASKCYFAPGSKVLCIHSGGLQGNLSLPKGSLVF